MIWECSIITMEKKSNAATDCHEASTVSKKRARQRYDPGDIETTSRDFKTFMQTYDVTSPNASKNSITGTDYRGGWPTCIDAFNGPLLDTDALEQQPTFVGYSSKTPWMPV